MRRYRPAVAALAAVVLSLGGAMVSRTMPPASGSTTNPGLTITTLANRADLISGPSTLLQIDLPVGVALSQVSIQLNGNRANGAFAVRPNGKIQGLLTGLQVGRNVVSALLPNGSGSQLIITDHPIGGPVIAGPQTLPWICNNEANGAGAPVDDQCDTAPTYSYQYKSSITGQFAAYNPANPPLDVAFTTTDQGAAVPYIVRIETGTIDRGVYQLAVLADPNSAWSPWSPQPAWNGKLYYQFSGGCNPDHSQGAATAVADTQLTTGGISWLDDTSLSRGFLDAISSNTTLAQDCNSVVSAETVMMVKEHIIDNYGPIRYTMSTGCSGGSMQQQWDVSDYPGLIDGIIPSCSFPDIWETVQEAEDCHLLNRVFVGSPALAPSQDFVTGYAAPTTCDSLFDNPTGNASASRIWMDPENGGGCLGSETSLSPNPPWVYDPQTNPSGVRCTLQDYMSSIFGLRPQSAWGPTETAIGHGFANRPFDNVGVQYGLTALNSGEITPQQFVDLNSKIGGLDIDWNWQPARSSADPAALTTAYRAGLVTYPKAAATVPIIDLRGALDVEIHTDFHSYAMRARLDQANGTHANQVIWTAPGVALDVPPAVSQAAFLTMDRWLSAISSDQRSVPLADKVIQDKPGAATDSCWINGQQITDQSICRAAFPYFADPRIAAGGPLADNILKCALKPLDPADYTVQFTSTQWDDLQRTFPGGVCDYTRPGVAQQPSAPWTSFADGPGGQPLGPAPQSIPAAH